MLLAWIEDKRTVDGFDATLEVLSEG